MLGWSWLCYCCDCKHEYCEYCPEHWCQQYSHQTGKPIILFWSLVTSGIIMGATALWLSKISNLWAMSSSISSVSFVPKTWKPANTLQDSSKNDSSNPCRDQRGFWQTGCPTALRLGVILLERWCFYILHSLHRDAKKESILA